MKKRYGILMPVFSLPGEYGIGTFGKESYDFIDFLVKSNHTVWQTLPVCQTVFGDSPYQTTSDKSFNPYFCDLKDLREKGLITDEELQKEKRKVAKIDYAKLYKTRYKLLKKAYSRFIPDDEFLKFVNDGEYSSYALFMALKGAYGERSRFPEKLLKRDKKAIAEFSDEHADEILFWQFLQYTLKKQYEKLKNYAEYRGVEIMGDLPLYVAGDSVEVWENPSQFLLDENLNPERVAGVPPDYFSADGQLWGNPVYNYAAMKENGYKWWKNRIKFALNRFDLVRIDHFRGLDRYWSIPNGEKAVVGEWVKADGREILKNMPKNRLIAEDLGIIDDGVISLLKDTGLPGMKVMLFAFDGNPNNPYLPENIEKNSVSYIGTHDNDTAAGYIKSLPKDALKNLRREVAKRAGVKIRKLTGAKKIAAAMVDILYKVKSELIILSFADACLLGNEYRINTPSTVGNWRVRFPKELFTDELAENLKRLADG